MFTAKRIKKERRRITLREILDFGTIIYKFSMFYESNYNNIFLLIYIIIYLNINNFNG
jgi:hypothetical protein